MKKIIKNLLQRFIPQYLLDLAIDINQTKKIKEKQIEDAAYYEKYQGILNRNLALKSIHSGKRCFILSNGPSIAKEDLKPLSKEICFSVSNFYKHTDYTFIKPAYHVVPNVFPPHRDQDIITWFQEMESVTFQADASLILGMKQYELVKENDIFQNQQVYFLALENNHFDSIALHQKIAGVQSVPIMCIMAAIYMGFSEIYLLGVDHDWWLTLKYTYFFDRSVMSIPQDGSGVVNEKEEIISPNFVNLETALSLWKQYLQLDLIAKNKNIKIINLSEGSALDVYPRSTLTKILTHHD